MEPQQDIQDWTNTLKFWEKSTKNENTKKLITPDSKIMKVFKNIKTQV